MCNHDEIRMRCIDILFDYVLEKRVFPTIADFSMRFEECSDELNQVIRENTDIFFVAKVRRRERIYPTPQAMKLYLDRRGVVLDNKVIVSVQEPEEYACHVVRYLLQYNAPMLELLDTFVDEKGQICIQVKSKVPSAAGISSGIQEFCSNSLIEIMEGLNGS